MDRVRFGVDPGVSTGLARSVGGVVDMVKTTDFWDAYNTILEVPPCSVVFVSIEVTNTRHVWHRKSSLNQAASIGGKVGAVRREGELLAEGLRRLGYTVKEVPPMGTKWIDADKFRLMTGWEGTTSQHGRDAAMLII